MANFVKLSSGQRINLDAIVRLIPGPFQTRNELSVICVSPEANFNLRDDRDILDMLKAVDGPQEVPFAECKNPDCPIGCPDSHCYPVLEVNRG